MALYRHFQRKERPVVPTLSICRDSSLSKGVKRCQELASHILTNGAQDLHENLLPIGDAAFPGLSNQNELN